MDLTKAPPICQKRTLAFVNHFIINTVSFLNKLMISCESKLQKFDQRMQKLEASLCILEAKLSSVPGLEVEAERSAVDSQPKETAPAPKSEVQESPRAAEGSTPVDSADGETSNAPEDTAPKEENPILARYRKMIHVGVPIPAVKMKMMQEGVDPTLLDQ